MGLSALDWAIILDTLTTARGIADGGALFHFTAKARADTTERVLEFMNAAKIPPPMVELPAVGVGWPPPQEPPRKDS